MSDHEENPYSPPNAASIPRADVGVSIALPPKARPLFRLLAAGLACMFFNFAFFDNMPLDFGMIVFRISMALFGFQFLAASITGRWPIFPNIRRRT